MGNRRALLKKEDAWCMIIAIINIVRMLTHGHDTSKQNVLKLLEKVPDAPSGSMRHLAELMWQKSSAIKRLVAQHGTPFYVFDQESTDTGIDEFTSAYQKHIPGIKLYYAVKTNYHPLLLKSVVKHGLGLDVSSARELVLGLQAGAKDILFSGPGKTEKEYDVFFKRSKHSTVIIDNFDELDRIGRITNKRKTHVRCGVRFYSSYHGEWSKFGIPLKDVATFYARAKKYKYLSLEGLHFHISLNRSADRYVQIIEELANYLCKQCSPQMRQSIKFIDIGGGFYPDRVEGFYPWAERYPWMLSGGYLMKIANDYFKHNTTFAKKYYVSRAHSAEKMARTIAHALKHHLRPLVSCEYYAEPGRIFSYRSMHIVTSVVDRKPGMVITDSGNNMVGWEAGLQFYYPIVNLTHLSKKEVPIRVYGSLCDPKDLWGYYSYSKKFLEGDVLAIPYQGAYRYTLAQNFIRPIPPVYPLE